MKGSRNTTPRKAHGVADLAHLQHVASVKSHEVEDQKELETTFNINKSYKGRTNPKPSREHSPNDNSISNRTQNKIHS